MTHDAEDTSQLAQPGDICIECGEDDLDQICGGYLICYSCRELGKRGATGMVVWLYGVLALLICVPLWILGLPVWLAIIPVGLTLVGGSIASGADTEKGHRNFYAERSLTMKMEEGQ